jgi:hypothetical protein
MPTPTRDPYRGPASRWWTLPLVLAVALVPWGYGGCVIWARGAGRAYVAGAAGYLRAALTAGRTSGCIQVTSCSEEP